MVGIDKDLDWIFQGDANIGGQGIQGLVGPVKESLAKTGAALVPINRQAVIL